MWLTRGVGRHREKLASFELALRDAGIAEYNLVRVSSIFPPECKLIGRKEALAKLSPGQVLYAVIAESATNEPNRLIAASIGVAIPRDRSRYGYLSEHHSYGETDQKAGDYAEDLAAQMLATTLGVEFDPEAAWDERKENWRISNEIVTTRNVTQSAIGDKDGRWSTVVAAAVLVS
ncbi:MAG TPA: arginine decarboxylase, pyruvoyl-dependent [Gemmatimonadota bacterium]|jgi:arginine decarboxylase|nr:arginine decarboxylase, pyruvoyl-dependent [Gemmatimonadota bacterium]